MMLSVIAETAGERIVDRIKEFLQICKKTLEDSEGEVCYYTIITLTHMVRRTGSDEVNMFQQLIPQVIALNTLVFKMMGKSYLSYTIACPQPF